MARFYVSIRPGISAEEYAAGPSLEDAHGDDALQRGDDVRRALILAG